MKGATKNRVTYFYNYWKNEDHDSNDDYGSLHPMKPVRSHMVHQLVLSTGLHNKMTIYDVSAHAKDMMAFHSEEYINFLKKIRPDTLDQFAEDMKRFNVGTSHDCLISQNMFDYVSLYTGGSIDGASELNKGLADIAINWSGGFHHAKKNEASGFCYVNDIVLAILELLKYHNRVLYIDIDIHHGDGVEEAFYTTDRVMTVSFHKFGDFFPGTGDIRDVGVKNGKYYSVNVPLQEGIGDQNYHTVFKPVIEKIMEMYRPSAVVMQCGADSLTGDRLGCFNLTLEGHAECVRFIKSFNIPMLVLGGGGYTVPNVARCWAYETSVLLDEPFPEMLPYNDFFDCYAPDYKLHLPPCTKMKDQNKAEHLTAITTRILQNLKNLPGVPSIPMHHVPPDRNADYRVKPDEMQDKAPDKRPRALTKEGAQKAEHSLEFAKTRNDSKKRKATIAADNACTIYSELDLAYLSVYAAVKRLPNVITKWFNNFVWAKYGKGKDAPYWPAFIYDPREEIIYSDPEVHCIEKLRTHYVVYFFGFEDENTWAFIPPQLQSLPAVTVGKYYDFVPFDQIIYFWDGMEMGWGDPPTGAIGHRREDMSRALQIANVEFFSNTPILYYRNFAAQTFSKDLAVPKIKANICMKNYSPQYYKLTTSLGRNPKRNEFGVPMKDLEHIVKPRIGSDDDNAEEEFGIPHKALPTPKHVQN